MLLDIIGQPFIIWCCAGLEIHFYRLHIVAKSNKLIGSSQRGVQIVRLEGRRASIFFNEAHIHGEAISVNRRFFLIRFVWIGQIEEPCICVSLVVGSTGGLQIG